jgi:kinesin family protein C1
VRKLLKNEKDMNISYIKSNLCTTGIEFFREEKKNIIKEKNSSFFSLDQIFDENSTQEDIFNELYEMIKPSLNGFKICIFAYGATGSGKT